MIEQAFVDLPQFNVYHTSLTPIVHYYKQHQTLIPTENEIDRLLPYAKQTDFILETFCEIVDDLNYDKEKFQNIIYTLDDDYDMLKGFLYKLNPAIHSHNELLKVSDNILTKLIKVQNGLGIIISKNDNQKV